MVAGKLGEIGTGNSKTGPSWSLPNILTCPGRTLICAMLCYASYWIMKMHQGPGNAYWRKWKACIQALKHGGSQYLASLIVQQIRKQKLKTLRIHDSGDFFSPVYVLAWVEVARQCPDVTFWFYTRSWRVQDREQKMLSALRLLASLDNVAGWISADCQSYSEALLESVHSVWAGIAYMETEQNTGIPEFIQARVGKARFINFACHSPRKNETIHPTSEVRQCPAITKAIPLSTKNPACLKCRLCLPT